MLLLIAVGNTLAVDNTIVVVADCRAIVAAGHVAATTEMMEWRI